LARPAETEARWDRQYARTHLAVPCRLLARAGRHASTGRL